MKHGLLAALFSSFTVAPGAELHPVVEVESGFLLGSARQGKWLSPAETARAMHGGEEYRLYGSGKAMGTIKGGRPKSDGEPCPDVFVVPFEGPRRAKVAIAADWNALPRTPVFASTTQPAYLAVVREFLQSKGIKNPAVKLTQVIRVDLDGDGVEEVLLSATNYFTNDGTVPSDAPAGSYSFVLLRREVKGSVKTSLIVGEFYPKGKSFNAPASYKVLATLDCDGDGRMEIFVEAAYYEGGWTTVYRCSPKKIEEMVSVACGA